MQAQIAQQPIGGLDEVLDRLPVHGSTDAGQCDPAPLNHSSDRSADRSDATLMNFDTQHSDESLYDLHSSHALSLGFLDNCRGSTTRASVYEIRRSAPTDRFRIGYGPT